MHLLFCYIGSHYAVHSIWCIRFTGYCQIGEIQHWQIQLDKGQMGQDQYDPQKHCFCDIPTSRGYHGNWLNRATLWVLYCIKLLKLIKLPPSLSVYMVY